MEKYCRKVLKIGLPFPVQVGKPLGSDGEEESCSEGETECKAREDDSSAALRSRLDEVITKAIPAKFLIDSSVLTYSSDKFHFYCQNSLSKFLLQKGPLNKAIFVSKKEDSGFSLRSLLFMDFRTNWLSYYNAAVAEKSADEEDHWTWTLTMLTYTQRVPLEQVANLECIATLSADYRMYARRYKFDGEEMFEKQAYDYMHDADNPTDSDFDQTKIAAIFSKHSNLFQDKSKSQSSKSKKKMEVAKEKYYNQVDEDSFKLAEYAKQFWPCDTIRYMSWDEVEKSLNFGVQNYFMDHVITEVDLQLEIWHKNFKFRQFVQTIQQKLDAAYDDHLNLVTQKINQACQPTTTTKDNDSAQVQPSSSKIYAKAVAV